MREEAVRQTHPSMDEHDVRHERLRFAQFELDLRTLELLRAGRATRLAPQPATLLAELARRPGELVTREELQAAVWPHSKVEFDQGLNSCIRKIRKVLGDNADVPTYIETHPRRGYRFIAPVERIGADPPRRDGSGSAPFARRWKEAAAIGLVFLLAGSLVAAVAARRLVSPPPPTHRVVVAVLPFASLSSDPEQESFADGLTAELISAVSRHDPERLGVIARTSAMHYKGASKSIAEIGAELGVDYVVEGSVRKRDGVQRIVAQLVRVSDQTPLWSERYDRLCVDVLGVQTEVAGQVAKSLTHALVPGARATTAASAGVIQAEEVSTLTNPTSAARAPAAIEHAPKPPALRRTA